MDSPNKNKVPHQETPVAYHYNDEDIVIKPVEEHKYTVIFLHGLGEEASSHQHLFEGEKSIVSQNTKVVLPSAPLSLLMIAGRSFRLWFQIFTFPIPKLFCKTSYIMNFRQLDMKAQEIHKLIDHEVKLLNSDSSKVILGGFSQGCMMALHTGITYKEKLGGLIGLSGLLFEETKLDLLSKDLPIFLWHGSRDESIPESFARSSYNKLLYGSYSARYIAEDKLAHGVSDKEKEALHEFIARVMKECDDFRRTL